MSMNIHIRLFIQGSSDSVDTIINLVQGYRPQFASLEDDAYNLASFFTPGKTVVELESFFHEKRDALILKHIDFCHDYLDKDPYHEIHKNRQKRLSKQSEIYAYDFVNRNIIRTMSQKIIMSVGDCITKFQHGLKCNFGIKKKGTGTLVHTLDNETPIDNVLYLVGTIENIPIKFKLQHHNSSISSWGSEILEPSLDQWKDLYDLLVKKKQTKTKNTNRFSRVFIASNPSHPR